MEDDNKDGSAAVAEKLVEKIGAKVTEKVTPLVQRIEENEKKTGELATTLKEFVEQKNAEIKALAESQRKSAGIPGWSRDPDPDSPKNPNLVRLIRGHKMADEDGNWPSSAKSAFPVEYAYTNEMRTLLMQRAQQSGIGHSGGVLIGTDMFPGIIDPLKARSIVFQGGAQAGINVLEGLTGGPLHFNRGDGGITASWKGESKEIAETAEAFDDLELRPREVAGLARTSKKQLLQDGGAMSAWLEKRLGQEIGLAFDRAFFKGAGNEMPVGILTAPAVAGASTDWNGVTLAGATQGVTKKLKDMVTALKARDAYYDFGPCWWFANPTVYGAFHNILDADGHPLRLFQQEYIADTSSGIAANDRFFNHRYAETTQLTGGTSADDLLLVATAACYLAMWGVIEILPNELAGEVYRKNDMWIRAVAYGDVAILRGEHMQRAANLDLTSV